MTQMAMAMAAAAARAGEDDGTSDKRTLDESRRGGSGGKRRRTRTRAEGLRGGDGPALSARGTLAAPTFLDDETARSLEHDERATDTARLRVVGSAALGLWLVTMFVDLGLAEIHSPFARAASSSSSSSAVSALSSSPALCALAVAAVPVALVLARLWIPVSRVFGLLSVRALSASAYAIFLPLIAATALLALRYPAIEAAWGHVVVTLLVAVGAALPQPLARGLPLALCASLAFAVVAVGAAAFDPDVRTALQDPAHRAVLWMVASSHVVAGALAVAGAHIQWQLRRQALVAQHRNRYRLEALLGEGGMGEVWRAWHPGLGCHVAVKMLRQGGSKELVRRFTREMKATAQLMHPHTVRVLDCGTTDDGAWYYTMELLHGRTLATMVNSEGPLPPPRAAYLVLQAARALAEAHDKGLVHRDVKPENIFVTTLGGETDFVKVLDFGIARSVTGDVDITREGMVIGTPRYMAPEQERGGADPRSDVYGLGATLYLALTGCPPLPGDSIGEVQLARLRGDLVPPSARVDGVPPALDALVMKCLRTNAADRFADAAAFAEALFATGLAQAHVPPPASEAVPMEPVRRAPVTRDLSAELLLATPTLPGVQRAMSGGGKR